MSGEILQTKEISAAEIIKQAPDELELEILAGIGNLDKCLINSSRIQKLGLALAGYQDYIHCGRIQMIGKSEILYLSQLETKAKSKAIERLELEKIRCVLVTKNLDLPIKLLDKFNKNNIPVLRTPLVSSEAIRSLSGFLLNALAPIITIHGVMLGMYGLGILILGRSGIGKSECALDLIRSGHRLISDDSVTLKRIGEILEGSSPPLTYEHLEIRGLGILNVKDLFGAAAVGQNRKVDLCIELKKWKDAIDIDRLGLTTHHERILDIEIPKFVLPVSSGRNITTLVETAVRVHLLRVAGQDSAQKFFELHNQTIKNKDN